MNTRMIFVGVALIVTQITLIRAQNVPSIEAISEDITGENFAGAVNKIKERGDLQSTMNSVIFKLNSNNNNEGVFNLLLQFLDYSAKDKEISLASYRALYKSIDRNNPKDRVKKLRLIQSFNSHSPQEDSKEFKDELDNSVTNIVLEDLKDALKTNNNDALSTLCEDVHKYYPELFKKVFKTALSEVFNQTNVENLIKFFLNHKHAVQNIYAFSALFDELKKVNLNQEIVVDVAFGLKEAAVANKNAGDAHDSEAQKEADKVEDNLPMSVRNLAFATKICIKNTDKKEYFYAASDGFNYDSERRNVFTWIPGTKVGQGLWFIERADDVYHIKNEAHRDEYLYASMSTANGYKFGRNVFTWIPKGTGNNDLEFNWRFEPSGDDVYIRNTYVYEFLYATIDTQGDDRRYIRTRIDKTKHKHSTWTIEDCSWVL